MTHIQILRRLNRQEKIGFFIKRKPILSSFIGLGILGLLLLILNIPHFIFKYKYGKAEKLLQATQSTLASIRTNQDKTYRLLEANPKVFKEYKKYQSSLASQKKEVQKWNDEIQDLRQELLQENVRAVLSAFKDDKIGEEIKELKKNKFDKLTSEIQEVYQTDRFLIQSYQTFQVFVLSTQSHIEQRSNQKTTALQKAKNSRVKGIIADKFGDLERSFQSFTKKLSQDNKFEASSSGKYVIQDLRKLKKSCDATHTLKKDTEIKISSFDSYWNELNEQYYTRITGQNYHTRTDYVSESNPAFREWQESETYTTTETRYKTTTSTKRVYKGSRIVNGQKEDIYENETVTEREPYEEKVTKTRSVTKNNGAPRYVDVPYTVYDFYYTTTKYSPKGQSSSSTKVGSKHSKYDSYPSSWQYKNNEQVGYTVWKQKWTDNQDIRQGMGLSVYLE